MEDTRILSENIEDYLDENGNVKEEFKDVKKVFLKDLPRKRNLISWEDSVGCEVVFLYNGLNGNLSISDYIKGSKNKIKIKYKNNTLEIVSSHFKEAKIGRLLGVISKKHQFKIGDVLNLSKSSIKIIECFKENNIKMYRYICLKDGYIGIATQGNINKKQGCPVCTNRKVIKGVNDIATTHPYLIKYFVNIDDAYKYSSSSGEYVEVVCLSCGIKRKIRIDSIINQKNFCPICSDGVPYPEKFISSLLNQIKIKFEKQKTLNKDNRRAKRVYDFYIPLLNCIIETHGMQHYGKGFENLGGRTLKEEQENDRFKEQLARDNGITHYIQLDCRKSELKWIKNSILKSELNELFDLSNIDWNECELEAVKSIVIKTWNLANDGLNPKDIAKQLNISYETVLRYINRGIKINKCIYEYNKIKTDRSYYNEKRVICIENNIIMKSASEFSRKSHKIFGEKICRSGIANCCNGKSLKVKGYTFRYIDDNDCIIEPKKIVRYNQYNKVVCIENKMEFESRRELQCKSIEIFGFYISVKSSKNVCDGIRKTYKGYTFRYLDENGNIIEPTK